MMASMVVIDTEVMSFTRYSPVVDIHKMVRTHKVNKVAIADDCELLDVVTYIQAFRIAPNERFAL